MSWYIRQTVNVQYLGCAMSWPAYEGRCNIWDVQYVLVHYRQTVKVQYLGCAMSWPAYEGAIFGMCNMSWCTRQTVKVQ